MPARSSGSRASESASLRARESAPAKSHGDRKCRDHGDTQGDHQHLAHRPWARTAERKIADDGTERGTPENTTSVPHALGHGTDYQSIGARDPQTCQVAAGPLPRLR